VEISTSMPRRTATIYCNKGAMLWETLPVIKIVSFPP